MLTNTMCVMRTCRLGGCCAESGRSRGTCGERARLMDSSKTEDRHPRQRWTCGYALAGGFPPRPNSGKAFCNWRLRDGIYHNGHACSSSFSLLATSSDPPCGPSCTPTAPPPCRPEGTRRGGLPKSGRLAIGPSGSPRGAATFQSRQCFSAEALDFFNREPAASKCMDRELEGGVGGIAFEASFEFLAPTSRASLTAQPLFAVTAEPVKGWSTWNPMGTGPETAKHPGSQPSKAARACRRRRVQIGQLRLAWPRRVASEALFSGQQSPAHSWAWRRLR